jgi:three-Cys-motif partner protein
LVKRADKYSWHIGAQPPPIDAHSVVKHEIVKSYLEQYIQVLMSNVRIEKLTLSIVDGFAGGGEYSDPEGGPYRSGSPLISLDAVRAQEVALNVDRFKERRVDAEFFFIEKVASNFAYLDALLKSRIDSQRLGQDVHVLKGTFQDYLEKVIATIKARGGGERALFLLDQYAYDQVPAPLLHRIFSELRGAEVLLTFNVGSLITFLSDSDQSRRKLEEMGLHRYIDWRALAATKDAGPNIWRSLIQRNLARGLVETSGAKHHTIFYITPIGSTAWTYWLVHLSNSYKARDVMMELHWQRANHFSHYLEPDLFTLGYETQLDPRATGQSIMEMGEEHKFDGIAAEKCRTGLEQKLVPLLYDRSSGQSFGGLLNAIGSNTPATAKMIRSALDPAIRSGDLEVVSSQGSRRTRGSTLHPEDIIRASEQRPLFLLPRN